MKEVIEVPFHAVGSSGGRAMKFRAFWFAVVAGVAVHFQVGAAFAQNTGPLLPHPGGQVTTAFSNRFGPDAESTVTFSAVTPEMLKLNYSSTRGLTVARNLQAADRQNSNVYVLGYAQNMPLIIPGTTSLGLSGASLLELRNTGRTALSLAYDAQLSKIDGQLTLVEKDIRVPIMIENEVVQVPACARPGLSHPEARPGLGTSISSITRTTR